MTDDETEKIKAEKLFERDVERLDLEHKIEEIVGFDERKKKEILRIIAVEKLKVHFKLIEIAVIVTSIICFVVYNLPIY